MCTLTWFTTDGGYELFFNRDEQLTRQRAACPSVQASEGVQYVSPTDLDAGGTWIAANQFGITVCLLNHYQFEQPERYKQWVSRGEIVRAFAHTRSLSEAERSFTKMVLTDYRAFRMFIIAPHGANRLFVWDGHSARTERDVSKPKSSSSVDAVHVKAQRRELFEKRNLAQSELVQDYLDFHASHTPKASQESVCMHRHDANTVSLSYISVDTQRVAFRYADGSPCEAELQAAISLEIVTPLQSPAGKIAVL